ncbi:MAG: peptidyl-prolyl cis-trans isomerase, partial [Candidatus Omnitrophica bacterium]|nr:peptidyl-prolyl cis-trans isomerase [Candidatus Omnitrophota bacterium]
AKSYYEKHKTEFLLPAKEGEKNSENRIADLEDVKASIHSYLAGKEAVSLSVKYTEELRLRIKEFMEKGSFEEAVIKVGSKTEKSSFFSITDYIEGIGEARPLAEAAANLKPGEISDPVRVRKGIIIFKILETQGIDEEKFKKDKAEFAKKILEKKKAKAIDEWFSKIYLQNLPNIDLNEIDKYYR